LSAGAESKDVMLSPLAIDFSYNLISALPPDRTAAQCADPAH
jgi:hypothetical protein